MKCWPVKIAAVLITCFLAFEAAAEDPDFLALSAGVFDFDDDETSAEFRYEYCSDLKLFHIGPFVGLMANTDGGVYGFGGLYLDVFLHRRLVVTPNLAVGGYSQGDSKDLGSVIEFRSGMEIAYRFDDRSRLGVAVHHISNASIDDRNPGVNSIVLTYAVPFHKLYD